jgi:hypothetical protein
VRRIQVRLDGNEQRVLKVPESSNSATLMDLVLPVSEHVMALRAARAKGPWSSWSADVKFGLWDVEEEEASHGGVAKGAQRAVEAVDENKAKCDVASAAPPAGNPNTVPTPRGAAKAPAPARTEAIGDKDKDARKEKHTDKDEDKDGMVAKPGKGSNAKDKCKGDKDKRKADQDKGQNDMKSTGGTQCTQEGERERLRKMEHTRDAEEQDGQGSKGNAKEEKAKKGQEQEKGGKEKDGYNKNLNSYLHVIFVFAHSIRGGRQKDNNAEIYTGARIGRS